MNIFSIATLSFFVCVIGCSNHTMPISESENSTCSHILKGSFEVYYNLQTSASSTSGTGNQPSKVHTITFHDSYIAIEGNSFGGMILPIDKIVSFSWNESISDEK